MTGNEKRWRPLIRAAGTDAPRAEEAGRLLPGRTRLPGPQRCDHRGSACLHRPHPPQAVRYDELPPFSWREAGEIALGAFVLSAAFVVIFVYGAIWAVTP